MKENAQSRKFHLQKQRLQGTDTETGAARVL